MSTRQPNILYQLPEAAPTMRPALPPTSGTPSKKLRTNARDLNLCEALHHKGFLTTTLIHDEFWVERRGGTDGARLKDCQRRCRELLAAGILRAFEQFIRYQEGKKPRIFALAYGGARLLAEQRPIDFATIDWRPTSAEDNQLFLRHILTINRLWLTFAQACARQGVVLETWRTDRHLKKAGPPDYITLTSPQGNEQKAAVIPDSVFVIGDPARARQALMFLESDLGHVTLSPSDSERRGWQRKTQIYLQYPASDAYQQRYGAQRAVVLTVTTSAARAAHMRQVAQNAGADTRFFFTTFDQLTPQAALRGTIWQRAQAQGLYALL